MIDKVYGILKIIFIIFKPLFSNKREKFEDMTSFFQKEKEFDSEFYIKYLKKERENLVIKSMSKTELCADDYQKLVKLSKKTNYKYQLSDLKSIIHFIDFTGDDAEINPTKFRTKDDVFFSTVQVVISFLFFVLIVFSFVYLYFEFKSLSITKVKLIGFISIILISLVSIFLIAKENRLYFLAKQIKRYIDSY